MTGRSSGGLVATAAVWLALAALPAVVGTWQLVQLAQFMTYGIFAMSLAFIWGQAGLLCFGQAIFFGMGGYAMAVVTKGMLPGVPADSFLGLAAAVALPALAANLLGWLLFRGRGLSGAFFAIVTLSGAVIVERAVSHWRFLGGFNGLMGVPPLGAGGYDLLDPLSTYYAMFVAALAVYALLLWLERRQLGTVLRALRDSDERTAYFGFDITAYKTFAFTVSGGVAGLAGALFVTQFGFVSPALTGFALSTEVLIWVALGGKEVLLAGFVGAILVRAVEGLLSERLGTYWLLVLGLLFILSVIVLPRGLLGWLLRLPLPARLAGAARSDARRHGRVTARSP
jgi:branched-chain amino acid transport system permease protein/urea transport system permease protein